MVRLLARALTGWALVVRGRLWWVAAGERVARPARPSHSPLVVSRQVESRARSGWLTAILGIGGLAGYLALVGGVLLWLRFRHAGLPVTQTLSLVPPNQLITTALTEFVSQIGLVVVALVLFGFALQRTDRTPSAPSRGSAASTIDKHLMRFVYPVVVVLVGLALPADPYGLVVWLSFCGPTATALLLPRVAPRLLGTSQGVALYAIAVGAFAALPVFARQLSDPLPIEGVRVVRPDRPDVRGGLITIRDSSVVLDLCGNLLVIPTEASTVVITDKPSGSTDGRTVFDLLHIRDDAPTSQPTRVC